MQAAVGSTPIHSRFFLNRRYNQVNVSFILFRQNLLRFKVYKSVKKIPTIRLK